MARKDLNGISGKWCEESAMAMQWLWELPARLEDTGSYPSGFIMISSAHHGGKLVPVVKLGSKERPGPVSIYTMDLVNGEPKSLP